MGPQNTYIILSGAQAERDAVAYGITTPYKNNQSYTTPEEF